MSRKPRAGEAGKPVTIRATADERELWSAAATAADAPSLSDAIRPAITTWAIGIVELRLPPGKRKTRLLAMASDTSGTQTERPTASKARRKP